MRGAGGLTYLRIKEEKKEKGRFFSFRFVGEGEEHHHFTAITRYINIICVIAGVARRENWPAQVV